MTDNLQETRPPEPPPAPPEVPKPTAQSNHADARDHEPHAQDTQQSAHQDARNDAQAEHAKATGAHEPDGLRPTPEFQARLDEHTAGKSDPEGLRPTPEVQDRLDAHTAAKAERDGSAQQDTSDAQGRTDAANDDRDSRAASPAGEQSSEQAAAREAAADEHAKATGPAGDPDRSSAGDEHVPQSDAEQSAQDRTPAAGEQSPAEHGPQAEPVDDRLTEETAATGDQTPAPQDGYDGPDRRQYDAKHLDPASDMRRSPETTATDDNPTSGETTTDDNPTSGEQAGSELRPVRNETDFETGWADDAYEKIRADDGDVAAIASNTEHLGFSPDDIQSIKDHVFTDEHLLDSYGGEEMGRFDADPRMAEAWGRLADGTAHPADVDLLRHEQFEANHMASTGDPSYQRAHAAALEAGFTWDDEAAANDGLGYQRP